MKSFLYSIKIACLAFIMRIFALVPGIGKQSKTQASHIHYRCEPVKLSGLAGLEEISFLFLTDAHIGGSIDAIAHQTSLATQMLLVNATKETTIILHGGDYISSEGSKHAISYGNFVHVAESLFS